MPRWLAIGTVPEWNDIKRFGEEMHETHSWRPDARTTVASVLALEDGRMMAECHAMKRELFEAWLQEKGWTVESITPITHMAKTGSIWEIT